MSKREAVPLEERQSQHPSQHRQPNTLCSHDDVVMQCEWHESYQTLKLLKKRSIDKLPSADWVFKVNILYLLVCENFQLNTTIKNDCDNGVSNAALQTTQFGLKFSRERFSKTQNWGSANNKNNECTLCRSTMPLSSKVNKESHWTNETTAKSDGKMQRNWGVKKNNNEKKRKRLLSQLVVSAKSPVAKLVSPAIVIQNTVFPLGLFQQSIFYSVIFFLKLRREIEHKLFSENQFRFPIFH